jgi:hypothetical protein
MANNRLETDQDEGLRNEASRKPVVNQKVCPYSCGLIFFHLNGRELQVYEVSSFLACCSKKLDPEPSWQASYGFHGFSIRETNRSRQGSSKVLFILRVL